MSTKIETGELPALFELSKHLVESGFLPEHIKKPGQAVAIILAGRELGVPPMRALRALTMVKGKLVESADSQLARFKSEGGKATFATLTEDVAELHLTHPNGDEHDERFTMADAKRASLTANATWAKYPKAMLRSRVITAGLKSVGWDGAVGNYDPEEAKEIAPPQPVVQMPRRLSEKTQRIITDEEANPFPPQRAIGFNEPIPMDELGPALERLPAGEHDDTLALLERSVAEVNAKAEAQVTNSFITEAQRKRMFGIAKKAGHTHETMKAWLESGGIESSKQITQNEYEAICERLADPRPLL